MQTLHLDSLASHIVAWHNRHPLARRIGIQHVQSMGYVVLPFEAAASTTVSTTVSTADSTAVTTAAGTSAELDITIDLPIELAAEPQPEPADGGTLRERAMARAQQSASPTTAPGPASSITPPAASHTATHTAPPAPKAARAAAPPGLLKPAFSEDFIQPLRPAAVAAFALQHGADEAMRGKDNPVRMIQPDGGLTWPLLQRRWLLTGQISVDGRSSRLLAGAGRSPALLGQRLWSLPRVALAVAGPLVLAAALVMGIWALLTPAAVQPAVAERAAVVDAAASAAASAPASAAAQSLTAAVPASAMPASATALTATPPGVPAAPASAPAARPETAQRPTDVDPSWGQVNLPSIGAVADEKRRAAQAVRQAGPAPAPTSAHAPAPALALTPALAPASAPAPSSAAAPATAVPAQAGIPPPRAGPPPAPAVVAGPVFALSSRLIRTKSESEQIADAVRGLLVTGSGPRLQVEAMRNGDDWRVVCWPFLTREQADKARALLASRGIKLQVVDF